MFHKRRGHIAAILMGLSVSAQPLLTNASELDTASALQATDPAFTVQDSQAPNLKSLSFDALRHGAKVKLSDSQQWVKAQDFGVDYKAPIQALDMKIDRFQDRVKPAGRSLKSSLRDKIRGWGVIRIGDRTVSAAGLLLMMAFGVVFFLLSISNATSRLGGRH